MDWMEFPAHWTRKHLPEIALSITAMAMMAGGPYINAGLKNFSRKFHWLLRYGLFVLLCTVGYGLIANFALGQTRGFLSSLSDWTLLAAVAGMHLVLAWVLKRDRRL